MSDILISADGVSKKFCRSLKKGLWYGLQGLGNELRGRRHGGDGHLRADEFWAVRDVSFELKRGECLGLIGQNGAGKTTLLRMLNGLIKPDQGRIEIRGKTGALIALGAGFNTILTGRENIYVNGSVLGLSKRQIDAKLDEIVDFAEIGDFIDTPVKNYSSGMAVRLGFSVAVVLIEPDVLFLDEVLAVGDIGFIIKCLNTMRKLTAKSAVVFVSHSMQHISSFCTRVMVMKHGETLLDTPNPADGIDCYYSLVKHEQQTSGTGEARVLGLDLLVDGKVLPDEEPRIPQGSSATAMLRVQVDGPRDRACVLLTIHDETTAPLVCTPIYDSLSRPFTLPPGEHLLEIQLGPIDLNAGKYNFVVGITDPDRGGIALARVQGLRPFRVFSRHTVWGRIVRPVVAQLKPLPIRSSTPPG
jgi:lipopolysaccharide transport system ATP-binding protein